MSAEYIERGAEPKPRYIDINAFFASENVNNVYGDYWELKERLDEVPAADVVSAEAYAQIMWERDTAIAQLAEYGVGLGEKKKDVEPVVHGVWVEMHDPYGDLTGWIHEECGRETTSADEYCSKCGAKMTFVERSEGK